MRLWSALVLALTVTAGCASPRGTIGAVLGQRSDGRLFVRDVPPGLAAAKAGLQTGDEILLIDGEDVRALTPRQLHDRLAGDVGEPVKLTLSRQNEVIRVVVPRSVARKHALPVRETEPRH